MGTTKQRRFRVKAQPSTPLAASDVSSKSFGSVTEQQSIYLKDDVDNLIKDLRNAICGIPKASRESITTEQVYDMLVAIMDAVKPAENS